MNRVSAFASLFTSLGLSRRSSAGDAVFDSRQQTSSFADSAPRDPSEAALDFETSRNFGPNDPVMDAPKFLWPCRCGARPVLRFKGASEVDNTADLEAAHGTAFATHVVRCPTCRSSGKPGLAAFEAITDWNKSNPDLDLSLGEFPFFELGGLGLRDARVKLVRVRTDLETQRLLAKQRQREGRDPGRRYRERIDAYLRWNIVAQALALAHSRRAGAGASGESAATSPIPALSASMLVVLRLASEGKSLYADCTGRSEHGARLLTVRTLVRRGLLDATDESLSPAGRDALVSSSR